MVYDYLLRINQFIEQKYGDTKEVSVYLKVFLDHVKNSLDNPADLTNYALKCFFRLSSINANKMKSKELYFG
jgi:hypothetical protein